MEFFLTKPRRLFAALKGKNMSNENMDALGRTIETNNLGNTHIMIGGQPHVQGALGGLTPIDRVTQSPYPDIASSASAPSTFWGGSSPAYELSSYSPSRSGSGAIPVRFILFGAVAGAWVGFHQTGGTQPGAVLGGIGGAIAAWLVVVILRLILQMIAWFLRVIVRPLLILAAVGAIGYVLVRLSLGSYLP